MIRMPLLIAALSLLMAVPPASAANVARVMVENAYEAQRNPPHIEDSFAIAPAAAMIEALRAMLPANGTEGWLLAKLVEASVARESIPAERGWEGIEALFTRDQDTRWNATVRVRLEAEQPGQRFVATADVTVRRTITLPENPTDAERATAEQQLLSELQTSLQAEIAKAIQEYMPAIAG